MRKSLVTRGGMVWVGLAILLLSGCGIAPPPGARDVAVMGSGPSMTLTVVPRFLQGRVFWRSGRAAWRMASWADPPGTMPRVLREPLLWIQTLGAGAWPGSPLPSAWAVWAGHVGTPLGWQLWSQPPTVQVRRVVSVTVYFHERAPYHGVAHLATWWVEGPRGRWRVLGVRPPETGPSGAALQVLWRSSTPKKWMRKG